MRTSVALRILGLALTSVVVLLSSLVLLSGLGSLTSFRIIEDKATLSFEKNSVTLIMPYTVSNPGPLGLEDVRLGVRLLAPDGAPLTDVSEDKLVLPPFSSLKGQLKFRLNLRELGPDGVIKALEPGYLLLEISASGDVGGLASFSITVRQPLEVRAG